MAETSDQIIVDGLSSFDHAVPSTAASPLTQLPPELFIIQLDFSSPLGLATGPVVEVIRTTSGGQAELKGNSYVCILQEAMKRYLPLNIQVFK